MQTMIDTFIQIPEVLEIPFPTIANAPGYSLNITKWYIICHFWILCSEKKTVYILKDLISWEHFLTVTGMNFVKEMMTGDQ